MAKLKLPLRTYIVCCVVACVAPIVFVVARLDVPTSLSEDIIAAVLGSVAAGILTYPAGVIGTMVSYAAVYFGLLTPTEAVLFAAPFYIGAGYLQWYVLIPKWRNRGEEQNSLI